MLISKNNLSGQTLIILLIVVTIMALLAFGKMGFYKNLLGTKDQPGAVKVEVNDMQKKVDIYNNQVTNELNN